MQQRNQQPTNPVSQFMFVVKCSPLRGFAVEKSLGLLTTLSSTCQTATVQDGSATAIVGGISVSPPSSREEEHGVNAGPRPCRAEGGLAAWPSQAKPQVSKRNRVEEVHDTSFPMDETRVSVWAGLVGLRPLRGDGKN